jgi:hypothetical protein
MPKLRILLADDHAVVREGLKALINAQPGMEVVGEAADGVDRGTGTGTLPGCPGRRRVHARDGVAGGKLCAQVTPISARFERRRLQRLAWRVITSGFEARRS